ncbi:MAG: DUF4224 domain-containing protein [Sulfuritalea sp.]|nr:DUF4224 domain-containing protein [Sulfuritalea sp.]
MIFLNTEEMQDLTGFKLATRQCRWLADHGYPFDTSRSGKPKVLRTYLEQRLCPGLSNINGIEEPNFAALR